MRPVSSRTQRSYSQRCAVRVTYSGNRVSGQWRAHGRYLEREAATQAGAGKGAFGSASDTINLARTLGRWQKSGDERMFKLIISPEFGEQVDLVSHTRTLMSQMGQDLGTNLEWAAVRHYNTSHPHVHIALRGINDRGEPLRLERDYIRAGIRQHAENLCTAQLGYRTQLDGAEAQRREIDQYRYTSLDRLITRIAVRADDPEFLRATIDPEAAGGESHKIQLQQMVNRLHSLQKMGLALPSGAGSWLVRRNFEEALRGMQRASDRQKALAAHGALVSDPRLPLQLTPPTSIRQLEGRVLGHGQEDATGRAYVLIEGTDEKVHFIYYDDSIESARHQGQMKANSFVRLRRVSPKRRSELIVDDLGDAERLLGDRQFVRRSVQRLEQRGLRLDEEPRWGGWLGRYQARLQSEANLWNRNRSSRDSSPLRHARQ
jgi:type IV secretory pathway VirD2 relaxase